MKHIDDGTLRHLVDEPDALPDSLQHHYSVCTTCQTRFDDIRTDALNTQALFARSLPVPANTAAAALTTFHQRVAATGLSPARSGSRPGIHRRTKSIGRLRVPLAALAACLAVPVSFAWTPAGSWAQDFITIFQPAQVVGIQTTTSDLQNLQSLSQYGTFNGPATSSPQSVTTAAAAADLSGLSVARPATLPAGVTSAPSYDVLLPASASFTFSADKARAAAAVTGQSAPAMPANIDGSTLDVTVGPAVVTRYGIPGDVPQLVVGEMRAPVVRSTGVTVRELENYVLSLPGVSPQLRSQIEAINDPTSTLPIPIPADRASSHPVTVQGVQGIEVGDNTGLGSGVIWEKAGLIYGVAGPLSEAQALDVANSLRP